ncbi:MAG TPA: DNA alkylation repair protein [Terracidiphilus sp.]|jgi:3-methyladenine DNA glycosylase AlkD
MKPPLEVVRLATEVQSRLGSLVVPHTAALRGARRQFSREIATAEPRIVKQLALFLLAQKSDLLRFFSYEMICQHGPTFEGMTTDDLLKLGEGIDSWSSVDCFAMYLSGPMWKRGAVSDREVAAWARSEDRWWRRAALVSTVALSRRGEPDDCRRVIRICTLLAADRDDMVVKALSWALRELAKKRPEDARAFLADHGHALASRVVREVNNKLATGLKTPRRTNARKTK